MYASSIERVIGRTPAVDVHHPVLAPLLTLVMEVPSKWRRRSVLTRGGMAVGPHQIRGPSGKRWPHGASGSPVVLRAQNGVGTRAAALMDGWTRGGGAAAPARDEAVVPRRSRPPPSPRVTRSSARARAAWAGVTEAATGVMSCSTAPGEPIAPPTCGPLVAQSAAVWRVAKAPTGQMIAADGAAPAGKGAGRQTGSLLRESGCLDPFRLPHPTAEPTTEGPTSRRAAPRTEGRETKDPTQRLAFANISVAAWQESRPRPMAARLVGPPSETVVTVGRR